MYKYRKESSIAIALHNKRLAWQLQSLVDGDIPEWISQGQTGLIM